MTKALTVLDKGEVATTEELEQLKARIVDYDAGCRAAFQSQMGYAFLAGLALMRAKELVRKGDFLKWRETELPQISRSSASRYAQFAEALIAQDPTVGSCIDSSNFGGIASLPDSAKESVIAAVHEVADGKTLTEMYRDLGVIRQPKKQAHHPKQVTPEEEIESKKDAANAELDLVCGYYRSWLAEDDETLATADQKKRKELRDLQITVGKRIKAMSPKSKAAKKKGGAK